MLLGTFDSYSSYLSDWLQKGLFTSFRRSTWGELVPRSRPTSHIETSDLLYDWWFSSSDESEYNVCMCWCKYIYMCICLCVCMYAFLCIDVLVCVCVGLCVCEFSIQNIPVMSNNILHNDRCSVYLPIYLPIYSILVLIYF